MPARLRRQAPPAAGAGPDDEPARCAQTYEFGNTGCAELTGVVLDTRGRPIAGGAVSVQGPVDRVQRYADASGYAETDATGRYRVRVIRWLGGPSPGELTGPDTLSVWVRAVAPPPAEGRPGARDSLVAVAEFRQVGEHPVTRTVPTIRVPVR